MEEQHRHRRSPGRVAPRHKFISHFFRLNRVDSSICRATSRRQQAEGTAIATRERFPESFRYRRQAELVRGEEEVISFDASRVQADEMSWAGRE